MNIALFGLSGHETKGLDGLYERSKGEKLACSGSTFDACLWM